MIGVGAGCLRGEETGFFGVFRVEGQRKRTGLLQFFRVGFAPLKPAEYIVISIRVMAGRA